MIRAVINKKSKFFREQGHHGIGVTKYNRPSTTKEEDGSDGDDWWYLSFSDGYDNHYRKKDLIILPPTKIKYRIFSINI